jgi:hypothetical protein
VDWEKIRFWGKIGISKKERAIKKIIDQSGNIGSKNQPWDKPFWENSQQSSHFRSQNGLGNPTDTL